MLKCAGREVSAEDQNGNIRPRTRLRPCARSLHHREVRWLRKAAESDFSLHDCWKDESLLLSRLPRSCVLWRHTGSQEAFHARELRVLRDHPRREEAWRPFATNCLTWCRNHCAWQGAGFARIPRRWQSRYCGAPRLRCHDRKRR